jgi:hypothetical protein
MRYKLFALVIAQILIVAFTTAHATDLRGGVIGYNPYNYTTGPLPGIPVGLFAVYPNGAFVVVRQTQTGLDGMYYLIGIPAGQYVLQIGGINYPLTVSGMPMQDIGIAYR